MKQPPTDSPPSACSSMQGTYVLGIGTDIVAVERVEAMLSKHEEAFWQRVFTAREREYCEQHKQRGERMAGRWAAKEAILKALGTGWALGIGWADVEVCNLPGGQPRVYLHRRAREIADQRGIGEVLISISHCRTYAVAFAMALGATKEMKDARP
ncbi:MAG: holo-[acyl-carrier-protein] synthase [Pirellulaceae bacterium]|nr:MAG: holo-[acyl-carrier-protein] synthase [Pirellulaceae bacterium]